MNFKVAYHPMWEQTLTIPERKRYEQLLSHYTTGSASISTHPVIVKQKKNGGIVATIFICNGLDTELHLQETIVKIIGPDQSIYASEHFTVNLTIPPRKAMPWSFVFKPEHVTDIVTPEISADVQIFPIT